MKIGYPCINTAIGCTSGRTFRLKSYSEERLKETVKGNLECLQKILEYNLANHLLFFRICSGLVPFASHPINTFKWQKYFIDDFQEIGDYIKRHNLRISLHPDQFTLINSINEEIFHRSEKELQYHAQLLDLMNLDTSAKIQIHVGGVYGDKNRSMHTFVDRYGMLEEDVKRRLVIENDERLFNVGDCLTISSKTGIPVLFDVFHHKLNHETDSEENYFALANRTWKLKKDGVAMVDYSSQELGGKYGQHARTIDIDDFQSFLISTQLFDFDIMLEIKDKEASAIKALSVALNDKRINIL